MYIKRLLGNKLLWISIIGIPLLIFILYIVQEVMPHWAVITGPVEPSPEKGYTMKYQFLMTVLEWNAINGVVDWLSHVFPLFVLIGLMNFKEDLNSYFILGKHRFKNYYGSLLKSIIINAMMITLAFTLGHMIIYIIFNQITPHTNDIILESTAYIFNFMLPVDYFVGNPMYYFLSTIIINDIPVIFSYSVLFGIMTLFTHKNLYLYISIPFIFVILSVLTGNALDFEYINTSSPFSGYSNKITEIWLFVIYPLSLSLILFLTFIKREKRLC